MEQTPTLADALAAWRDRLDEAEVTPEMVGACQRLGRLLAGGK